MSRLTRSPEYRARVARENETKMQARRARDRQALFEPGEVMASDDIEMLRPEDALLRHYYYLRNSS